ncbi:MAG: phosphatidylglycerophosphatase A, partial [Gammaproteobacteria bacterium]
MTDGLDLRKPSHLLAFGFGSGLAPVAPGTAGTLVGIPLFMLLSQLPLAAYLLLTLALFVIGVRVCGLCSRDLGVHDHGGIVWDEIVGYLVTMIAVPFAWQWILSGFLLFRLFDILKPWPIRWLDRRVKGGFGIMVDDLLAGLFALAGQQLL